MNPESRTIGARRLRELFERHGVSPSRSLGQNFVIDPNTIGVVIAAADLSPSDRVLEIGAGAGSLTVGLAALAKRVIAVEFDRRLVPVLGETLEGFDNVELVEADALRMDLAATDANCLIGNLPYNIATTVVLRALEEAPQIHRLTVMTQREVGERLAASPGSKAYGATSVLAAYFADVHIAARVSRRAFYPVPNVDSVVLRLDRRKTPADVDRAGLFRTVKAAFSQRRKTLRNTLASLAGSAERAEAALRAAGIEPTTRAEDVDLSGFMRVAREL